MATKTDFLVFYQYLGVSANCSLDELKRAYRRRVATLHPDRHPDRTANAVESVCLQELTASYDAVMAFQRSYGRLPGASQPAIARRENNPQGTSIHRPVHPPHDAGQSRVGRTLLLIGLLIALAWIFLSGNAMFAVGVRENGEGTQHPVEPELTVAATSTTGTNVSPPQTRLVIGMDKPTVRRIEGAPLSADSAHWDYGPSWIDFDDAGVSDWYSSRLRPLKVASRRPLAPSDSDPIRY
ncbi:MAG: J domain-containing protein [Rhodanobacteraceae bacterium]